jgi:thiol-disulfide isomerase/thioredoxin
MTIATTSITPERFGQGLTITEYINGMQENREKLEGNYSNTVLTNAEIERIQKSNIPVNVLVIAEDWCGDVLRYLPMLARMAEVATNWKVRIFYRDRNLDLAERWLKDGIHRAIPVIAFFDENWNELGYYQEKPAQVYKEEAAAIANFATLHPDLPDSSLPYAEMSDATKQLYAPYMVNFRLSRMPAWQSMFVDEVLINLR